MKISADSSRSECATQGKRDIMHFGWIHPCTVLGLVLCTDGNEAWTKSVNRGEAGHGGFGFVVSQVRIMTLTAGPWTSSVRVLKQLIVEYVGRCLLRRGRQSLKHVAYWYRHSVTTVSSGCPKCVLGRDLATEISEVLGHGVLLLALVSESTRILLCRILLTRRLEVHYKCLLSDTFTTSVTQHAIF